MRFQAGSTTSYQSEYDFFWLFMQFSMVSHNWLWK
uniref:Uncharacterized protein n=1 Tax=Rhizophora mucronata TaxID=61149 RepID=A0A2P2R1T0_RHIMU